MAEKRSEWNKKVYMVVSGALSLGATYHALSLSLRLFSFCSTLLAEATRLSYFTVKIVECSFREAAVRAVSREESARGSD